MSPWSRVGGPVFRAEPPAPVHLYAFWKIWRAFLFLLSVESLVLSVPLLMITEKHTHFVSLTTYHEVGSVGRTGR